MDETASANQVHIRSGESGEPMRTWDATGRADSPEYATVHADHTSPVINLGTAPIVRGTGERPYALLRTGRRARQNIDGRAIDAAIELLEDTDDQNEMELQLSLSAFAARVEAFWESAENASEEHESVLSIIETAAISAARESALTNDQWEAIVYALRILRLPSIAQNEVETIREMCIRARFSPLAFFMESQATDQADHEQT